MPDQPIPVPERETTRGTRVELPPPTDPPTGPDVCEGRPGVSTPIVQDLPSDSSIWAMVMEAPIARDAIEGRRIERMGPSFPRSKERGGLVRAVYVVFRYDDQRTLEISVDLGKGEVTGIEERAFQPGLTLSECKRAIALASTGGTATQLSDDDRVVARLIEWEPDPATGKAPGRHVAVGYFWQTDRLPQAVVLVDLVTEAIVPTESAQLRRDF